MYDYGRCHVCGASMEEESVNQGFWIKGKLIVVEGIPAGVCAQCGEKVVKADVGRRISALVEDAPRLRKARTMSVPVMRFARRIA